MIQILILEDDDLRVIEFKKRIAETNADINLIVVDQAIECIKHLSTQKFDIIFLDHDLGGEVLVSSTKENTGATVARFWKSSDNMNKYTTVVIHSLNPAGSSYMMNIISDVIGAMPIKVPIIWDKIWWDILIKKPLEGRYNENHK